MDALVLGRQSNDCELAFRRCSIKRQWAYIRAKISVGKMLPGWFWGFLLSMTRDGDIGKGLATFFLIQCGNIRAKETQSDGDKMMTSHLPSRCCCQCADVVDADVVYALT